MGLDPLKVNRTVRVFFGYLGVTGQMKLGNKVNLTGYGQLKPGRSRLALAKRKQKLKKALHRMKMNKYFRKKRLQNLVN